MGFVVVVYATTPDQARRLRTAVEQEDIGRTVGVYRLPKADQESTCNGACGGSRKHLSGWGRHPEQGHIVHECGRRHRDWRKRIATVFLDTLGINLLNRADTPALFQNPEGWGR